MRDDWLGVPDVPFRVGFSGLGLFGVKEGDHRLPLNEFLAEPFQLCSPVVWLRAYFPV